MGSSVLATWGPEQCKDPSTLETCFKDLKKLEKMKFPTNNETLERDCEKMRSANKCYHEYLDHCFDGSVKSVLKDYIKGVRETVQMLCDNDVYREELQSHYDCFQRISDKWNECGSNYYQKASTEPSQICSARKKFIHCSMDHVTEENGCPKAAVRQVCRISNFYSNIIVSNSDCFTWTLCPSKAAVFLTEPSFILLLATVLLVLRHL
ncbi:uncharacterized protein [Anabrus simplex]|uniref:uncharacterized protein isoform X2 n=1 Tax=Anabrus simplex TaxID=316456 RepID=UPI0035A370F7